jgi:hypothetical protein
MKLLFILLNWSSLVFLLPVKPNLSSGEDVKWDQMVCDFGDISFGKPVSNSFEVTNFGSEVLVIERVKGSCGCTATDYTKEPIAPGKKGYVSATYNAKTRGAFKKTVSVYTNIQKEPYILTIKGNVISETN